MQDNGQQTFLQILCQAGLDADALCVSLRAARLDMQKKCLQIELEGSAKPQESCLRALRSAVEEAVPGVRADVCWTTREKCTFDASRACGMKDQMIDYADSKTHCRRLLQTATWRADDAGNVVIVPRLPDAHVILKKKKCDQILSAWLAARFENAGQVLVADAVTEAEPDFEAIAREVVLQAEREAARRKKKKKEGPKVLFGVRIPENKTQPIESIDEGSGTVILEGDVFELETRQTRGGRMQIKFSITDYAASATVKCYMDAAQCEAVCRDLRVGVPVRLRGDCAYDRFERECVVTAHDVMALVPNRRTDNAEKKRVELHLHTKMSNMDSVAGVKEVFARAKAFGHEAVAITDHGVIQAYPDAYAAARATGVRFLAGVEAYLVDDEAHVQDEDARFALSGRYCVFDIETTGLDAGLDAIIEIGAVIVEDGEIRERYASFVNPGRAIPEKIRKLTGIDDSMVRDAPPIETVLPEFLRFAGDAPFVAHNASFDTGFIAAASRRLGLNGQRPSLDTLSLSRQLVPELRGHKLNHLTRHFNVELENHHRAVDDALACAHVMLHLFDMIRDLGGTCVEDVKARVKKEQIVSALPTHHTVIFAKNQDGLRDLYELITESHLRYFYRRPRMPKSRVAALRENLLIGSACENGEVYTAVRRGVPQQELERIASFYDYLEIQPDGNNAFMLKNGTLDSVEDLHRINREIIALGRRLQKDVVATGDVHYIDQSDAYFREILQFSQGFADEQSERSLYYRTTQEMLDEFAYLDEETARDVVIDAPNRIAAQIESIVPIPEGLHPPVIEGSDEQIRTMAWARCHEMYGDPAPEIVQKRLERELNSIISNNYSVLYLIAQKLVTKSLADGYLVGSRGSVGSSLAATMCSITEVNPLPPHYRCAKCRFSDFDVDADTYAVGPDLPRRKCPVCGEELVRDGYDIPFEVFLGFKGDKVPDIDLNFSGEYQPVAHRYTEEIFGKGQVFRAGTVGTIADRTAFGHVRHYLQEHNRNASQAELRRLTAGCTGIKRTTGQHPGGIVVLPKGEDINRFTPLQHPADDAKSDIVTSHFEFSDMHDTLVKLDILGHVDPTVIRMLEDMTGVNARAVPITDEKVISLFSSTEALGITPEQIDCPVGTFGLPEFGTPFVRQMLVETTPTSMSELIRIAGLSHGTDVWLGNAQDLIRDGVTTLREAICTRDDIMNHLMKMMEPIDAFKIMESVRKGKGLVLKGDGDMEPKMRQAGVEEWFIDSCKKIGYMFPKAHAAAYVMMGLRIAWFKVYRPAAFYATYFTARTGTDFDASVMLADDETVRQTLSQYTRRGKLNPREKSIQAALEVIVEMHARGIHFAPIDLYQSDATRFTLCEEGVRPPFTAIAGLGENVARGIVEGRAGEPFRSIEDFKKRTRAGRAVIDLLRSFGVLHGLHESDQMNLLEQLAL
jgi:DNA polymerase-3 subunit alpha (Gram-positive type)